MSNASDFYCGGCNETCANRDNNTDGNCPCTVCIVKPMCTTDGCDNWLEWEHLMAGEG